MNLKNIFSYIIKEETRIMPDVSNLPLAIWVEPSDSYKKGGHANRIKVQNGKHGSLRLRTDGIPFVICDNPFIPDKNTIKSKIVPEDEETIKAFIKANVNLLTQLSEGKITPQQFNKILNKI